jgi:hypothetical protein
MTDLPSINDLIPPASSKIRDALITVHCYDFTDDAIDALFDRVADAAHALDEQVMCSGVAKVTRTCGDWRHKLAKWLLK